jgi:branched-chain amino acid transport system substrate-binding protein
MQIQFCKISIDRTNKQSEALPKSSISAYGTRMLIRKALWQTLLLVLVFASSMQKVEAQDIGVVAPLSGTFAPLGKQMLGGAQAAAQRFEASIFTQDEVCTPEGGMAAANALVAQKIAIVIGFTCFESLNAALPILSNAGIVTITTGVRADVLTDTKAKTGHLLYRLGPREDMEVKALISALQERWRNESFAIIDDGTVLARNTAEELRFALTENGLKPVFTDTFRPGLDNQAALVRRLQKAGATHVFIGGDIEDALVISKAAKGEMEIAVGEAPNPEGNTDGTGTILSVTLPNYRMQNKAALASVDLQKMGLEPDNYALTTYAAIEIAASALSQKLNMAAYVNTAIFVTALGEIQFDEKGDLKINPFALAKLKNGSFNADISSSQ